MNVTANYVRLSTPTLARWRGEPGLFDAICAQQFPDAEHLDLDRAWDGLTWLLSPAKRKHKANALVEEATVQEEIPPDAMWTLIEGLACPHDPALDFGYGPARVLDPAAVALGSKRLDAVIQQDLRAVYDPDAMDEHEIVPGIWLRQGRGALEEYLLPYFERLRAFLRRAREAQQPVVLFFG
jgi:hypothetical protein